MTRLLYGIAEAAAAASTSEDVIRRAIRSGDLPAVITPGTKSKPSVRHDDLIAWCDQARPYPIKRAAGA